MQTTPSNSSVPSSPSTETTTSSYQMTGTLREQLERTYAAVRASFEESTPATYLLLIDAKDKTPEIVQKLRQNWADSEIKHAFKQASFPDLAGTNFVDAKQQGEYAAYYFISDPQDTNYLTIEVIRFHQVGGIWLMGQKRYSTSIPIGANPEENRQKTLHEIETDPELALLPR